MLYKYSWLIRADKRFNMKGNKQAPSAHQTASSKITYYNKTGKADPPIRKNTYLLILAGVQHLAMTWPWLEGLRVQSPEDQDGEDRALVPSETT